MFEGSSVPVAGLWLAVVLTGCGDAAIDNATTTRTDAGRADARTAEAGVPEAGTADAAATDGSRADSGRADAGPDDSGRPDRGGADTGDLDGEVADGFEADASPPLPPPAARPPADPPNAFDLVQAVAAEFPERLANSCIDQGGDFAFLDEVVRRARQRDPRWGFVRRGGALEDDRIAYFWGEGRPDDRREIYVLDVIARSCGQPGVDEPPAPSWLDDSAAGGTWAATTGGAVGPVPDAGPAPDAGAPADLGPDRGAPPGDLPLPDESDMVDALAAERPDLLAASCVPEGGNNDFLFELVHRLRARDRRWGLNWKRGNVGDMSQDVVDYYYGPEPPDGRYEGRTEVYIIDVISGHCGPDPGTTWIDQTEPTRVAGSIGRWTLEPLPPRP